MESLSPCSTINPRYMMPSRSVTWRTTDRSGDEQVGEAELVPEVHHKVQNLGLIDVQGRHGSPATMKAGLVARALAMPIRCLCPPENWWG